MAWRSTCNKTLSEPMMAYFTDAHMRHMATMGIHCTKTVWWILTINQHRHREWLCTEYMTRHWLECHCYRNIGKGIAEPPLHEADFWVCVTWVLRGVYSLSGWKSYRRISCSLWAARLVLDLSNRSENWQAPRKQRSRDASQISERYDYHNLPSCGYETSQDLTVRRLTT